MAIRWMAGKTRSSSEPTGVTVSCRCQITNLPCAKTWVLPCRTSPSDSSLSTNPRLAETKTSKGAPCSICLESKPEEPKVNTALMDLLDARLVPISVNAGVRSEAAATLIVTDVFVLSRERFCLQAAAAQSAAQKKNHRSSMEIQY